MTDPLSPADPGCDDCGPDAGLVFPGGLPPDQLRMLAEEVIRRVAEQARDIREARLTITEDQLSELAEALLQPDDHDRAAVLVRDARLSGVPADALYHGLVAGAVRQVGDAWARGDIGLHDMMRVSGRVLRIMRDLRDIFVQITGRKPGQRAVFALCPGECHTIGLTMTADDLRRRGWDIDLLMGHDDDSLLKRLSQLSPTTIAMAATTNDLALPLARTIVALRAHLPGVWVMVGRQIAHGVPDILAITGADALARSADEAEAAMLAHIADPAARRSNRI
jgi:methanogenic corrinoid protein MtbC1